MNRNTPAPKQVRPGFPTVAKRRMAWIGAGWVLAALAEATAYTVLAFAIRDRGGVLPVLAAAAVSLVATVLVSRSGYLSGARLAGDLYAQLGRSLSATKLSWFTAENRALVTTVAGRGIPALMGVPAHQLQTVICAPLVPVLMVVAVGFVSGAGEACVLALLLLAAFATQMLTQRHLQRADAERHRIEQETVRATMEFVDHLELIRTAAGPRGLVRADEAWRRQEQAMARTNQAAAPATLVSFLASVMPVAGMLIMLAASGEFAAPEAALALLVLTIRASAPIDELALAGVSLNEVRSHSSAYHTAAMAPRLPAPADPVPPAGSEIELRDVAHPPALRTITANIPPGARVHIAGPSGAGKSTLLGLLQRFDDPADGTVTLGGVSLAALEETEITARIAYVPQDPIVLTGTLAENIKLGRPEASDKEIIQAAERAQLREVITRDPLGIHQHLGIHGQALSGGERQRVAIARALLKNAPVLVLDEATSALDTATEQRIADTLATYDGTLIFVTHRDPTIWHPNRTITLEGPQQA
ncbi:TPA: ATP-binding cassette domain-containing protein [Corynebacterium striatum]|nr:ATP-binding cassette domain-containing protein [Corynebacterium striatum]HAT1169097.1 ATP-binding cassette domain-containing protein [Corynebacterium striatum]HAT1174307.1 ATP-binding cassette domain-containing protein [Corynebacterium striatum]HAT1199628.1 ATP-binding cassette domain-containing protein [Corynebacterium striatum]HAT1202377.1 ATP-binding cassette domain-containing protein [Corynebacterium striatum]